MKKKKHNAEGTEKTDCPAKTTAPKHSAPTNKTQRWSTLLKLASWTPDSQKNALTDKDRHVIIKNELSHMAFEPYCTHSKKGSPFESNCLDMLQEKPKADAVANFIFWLANLDTFTQQLFIMERIRACKRLTEITRSHNTAHFRGYVMPFICKDNHIGNQMKDIRICKHSFMRLLRIGGDIMRTLQNHVNNGTTPTKKMNNLEPYWRKRYNEIIKPPLDLFFRQRLFPLTTAHPKLSGVHELDSDWSKRKVYGFYCNAIGYEVKTDAGGKTKLEDIEGFPPSEKREACSWRTFLRYWTKEHPNLRVRSKPKGDGGNSNNNGSSSGGGGGTRGKKRKAVTTLDVSDPQRLPPLDVYW
mmetsp:Transcript_2114/g.3108  ORF Transcript_2114/g.3108 Transcript_2114/m.3108 type:complete len:356 (+) Transcript_2114:201-1268(+)